MRRLDLEVYVFGIKLFVWEIWFEQDSLIRKIKYEPKAHEYEQRITCFAFSPIFLISFATIAMANNFWKSMQWDFSWWGLVFLLLQWDFSRWGLVLFMVSI